MSYNLDYIIFSNFFGCKNNFTYASLIMCGWWILAQLIKKLGNEAVLWITFYHEIREEQVNEL